MRRLVEAVLAAAEAHRAADAVYFPRLLEVTPRVVANLDLSAAEPLTLFTERVCMAGQAEAVAADDPGRRRYEHDLAELQREREERQADRERIARVRAERERAAAEREQEHRAALERIQASIRRMQEQAA